MHFPSVTSQNGSSVHHFSQRASQTAFSIATSLAKTVHRYALPIIVCAVISQLPQLEGAHIMRACEEELGACIPACPLKEIDSLITCILNCSDVYCPR